MKEKIGAGLVEFLKDLLVAAILAAVVLTFIKPTIVKESSMEPTLYENNYLLLSRQAYRFGEPKRGDIIVFHTNLTTNEGKEKLLIKRVIGLPGETVTIVDGEVYIDGVLLSEDYIKDGYTKGSVDNLLIPEGEVFAMGDNREVSLDSRYPEVGNVEISKIVGKAFLRLFPFNQITRFGTVDYGRG